MQQVGRAVMWAPAEFLVFEVHSLVVKYLDMPPEFSIKS